MHSDNNIFITKPENPYLRVNIEELPFFIFFFLIFSIIHQEAIFHQEKSVDKMDTTLS